MRPEFAGRVPYAPRKKEYFLRSIAAIVVSGTALVGSHKDLKAEELNQNYAHFTRIHNTLQVANIAADINVNKVGPELPVELDVRVIELKVNEQLNIGFEKNQRQVSPSSTESPKKIATPIPSTLSAQSFPVPEKQAPSKIPSAEENKPVEADDLIIWDEIAHCESTDNWSIDTSNGYFGGLQMDMGFWTTYGGLEYAPTANLATKEQQITVARRARDGYHGYAARGYTPWPNCGKEK